MDIFASFEPLILGVHFVVSIFMIIVILLQAGKGADMGAAFGAGSSQTVFGARGATTFLSKITTTAAIVFLVTSVSLAAIHKKHISAMDTGSVMKKEEVQKAEPKETAPQAEEETTEKK